ncbi:MAG: anti-sigma factor [Anaerolineales bacterium]|nr:anti-sigma factor [Anaerolineales bacterium]
MSNDLHVQELLPAYVIGALEVEEAQRVDEHVRACSQYQRELGEYAGAAKALALWAPDVAPRPEVKERLMQRIRAARSAPPPGRPTARAWPPRWLAVWRTASALLVVALLAANLALWQRTRNIDAIAAPGGMVAIALTASDALPDATGFVLIGADGRNGALVVDRLPALPDGQTYQVWLMRQGEEASGALFSTGEAGYRGVRLKAPRSLLEYTAVDITIEPAEGSARPTGVRVLGGALVIP